MKRDMNLVREVLLALESESSGFAQEHLQVEGYNNEQIGYHTLLLLDAGFVEGQRITTYDSDSPSAIVTRITWAGHEFLDAARDKGRWNEALRIVQEKGGGAVTVGVLTQMLSALAKQAVGLG